MVVGYDHFPNKSFVIHQRPPIIHLFFILCGILTIIHGSRAFIPSPTTELSTRSFPPTSCQLDVHGQRSRKKLSAVKNKNESENDTDITNNNSRTQNAVPLAKTSWYVVEAFGNVFGSKKKGNQSPLSSLDTPPKSVQETLQRIQDDYTRSYFLSGQVDALIYDEKCIFSDPFVSFEGRDRFITNLANLGSFITKYSVRPLTFDVKDPSFVVAKSMVKLELALPWSPVLAWPWGVEYTIDPESCLILDHKETWDIEPIEGVKQIFRKPTVQVDAS